MRLLSPRKSPAPVVTCLAAVMEGILLNTTFHQARMNIGYFSDKILKKIRLKVCKI